MSVKVKFWGVRGSLPSSPSPEQWVHHIERLMAGFFRAGFNQQDQIKDYLKSMALPAIGSFGAATTCVEVKSETSRIIIDGGSGIRGLGDHLVEKGEGRGPFHIFLTHFHWDHLIGLPFFSPHFFPGTKIHYYAVQPDLMDIVKAKFRKPNFPVPFETLRSDIQFHQLKPRKPIVVDDIQVTPYMLDHPDPCWGYRIVSDGKVYSHCVDTECTRQTREAMGIDLPLYQGADLMYFDAQYTLPELAEKENWGHSAAQIGIDIAFREEVKSILFAHHDPGATTQQVYHLIDQTREYYQWKIKNRGPSEVLHNLKWKFAYEGLEVDLDDV
jgi:phosphoribosyl 1,2-cyclic phosphodiesterase